MSTKFLFCNSLENNKMNTFNNIYQLLYNIYFYNFMLTKNKSNLWS